jgi:2,4-dienoyl-CoA reductase-like NADH-dependent reductase (Old Yellow Enzyme family)
MQREEERDVLFTPITVNGRTLRNRFVMPAMQRGQRDYAPTAGMADMLREAAEGGSALIIAEGAAPDHPASYWQPIFGIIGQGTADRWRDVAEAVTTTGDVVFLMQLWHPGALRLVLDGVANPYPDHPSLSPSGLVQEGRPNGRAMTVGELLDTKEAYVEAALIAQEAGAHGVEVHCAHGYLLDLFLWHETNLRDDGYGGPTLAERSRFPAEVIAAIREATGPDFIISVRFSQWKEVDYRARIAQTPEELGTFLARIEEAGADLVHVSTRRFDAPGFPELDPDRSLASWVKSLTSLPVVAIGSVGLSVDMPGDMFDAKEPELQVEADLDAVRRGLEAGDFDLIGVGRAQIANIDFVRRVRDGEFASLRTFRREVLDDPDGGYVHEGQLVATSRKTD